jgi:hypothetical protein
MKDEGREKAGDLAAVQPKPETRGPRAERNPKAEGRIHRHPGSGAAHRIKAGSGFGIRPSFGSRVSVFGFQ